MSKSEHPKNNSRKPGTEEQKSPSHSSSTPEKRRTRREIIEANLRAIKQTRMAFG